MSSSEPFFPLNNVSPPLPESDLDLHPGPVDGPDVIIEASDDGPEITDLVTSDDLPIRKPTVGEQLTVQQLTDELDNE